MIERIAATRLIKLAKAFRSVAVVGPRQSGKTTLSKKVFPQKPYISLENPDTLEFANADPRGFLGQYRNGAILDEIQRAPHLFSYLQQVLDETKKKGLFILTGSNNFLLQENITQTLSGRIAYLQLLPLSLQELKDSKKIKADYRWHILHGGYPEVIAKRINPADWYAGYINTYVERDVRQLKNISSFSQFIKLLRLCAGRTGQILNLTSLSNDCGIDQKTVAAWLSVLQSSYIVYLLKPYHGNFNKRIIKTPKLYFYDTGIASFLLNIRSVTDFKNHFARGALYENFIITELMKNCYNKRTDPRFYYFRDSNGNEVDLVIPQASYMHAIEIKAGKTVNDSFFKGLNYFKSLSKRRLTTTCVYGSDDAYTYKGHKVLGWDDLQQIQIK